jgi:hypothetical protein
VLHRGSERRRWADHRGCCECGFWSRSHRASGQDPGSESPPCAGRAVVRPDDGAVDHLQYLCISAAIGECLQHHVPDAACGPTPELPPDRVPVAKFSGQIAPRCAGTGNPEDRIQHPAVVTRRSASRTTRFRHERPEELPFPVTQQTTDHRRSPTGRSASNHTASRRGNPPRAVCPRGLVVMQVWERRQQLEAMSGLVSRRFDGCLCRTLGLSCSASPLPSIVLYRESFRQWQDQKYNKSGLARWVLQTLEVRSGSSLLLPTDIRRSQDLRLRLRLWTNASTDVLLFRSRSNRGM